MVNAPQKGRYQCESHLEQFTPLSLDQLFSVLCLPFFSLSDKQIELRTMSRITKDISLSPKTF